MVVKLLYLMSSFNVIVRGTDMPENSATLLTLSIVEGILISFWKRFMASVCYLLLLSLDKFKKVASASLRAYIAVR